MKSYDKTLTRLILILTKLSTKELPTIKELSEEFGVGIRTIQRDLYERLNYFPIEKNSLGQLQFIDGFSLDRSTLENDEMLLVYLAMSQVKNINTEFEGKINNVFSKLLYPSFSSPYYIKRKGFETIDINSELLNTIEYAIDKKIVSTIHSKFIQSNVCPYKVVNFDGLWYLFARDMEDNKVKSYLIADMKNFELSSNNFFLDVNVDEILNDVYSAWFQEGNAFDVIVTIDSAIAHVFKLRKVIPSQEIIEEYSCGTLKIKFQVSHFEDIDNIIKSWLPHVKVIEPESYKSQLEKELSLYLNQ